MTKYILNSGGLKSWPEKAVEFNREIVKDLGNKPRILFCYFAIARENWEGKFSEYNKRFLESMEKGVEPIFELAYPDKFTEQIKNNDAIMIHGGDDNLLLYWLKQFNLPEIWKDKVVAGSSAGSDVLVKHFWACDWRQCLDGLGILEIKFIPHYKSETYDDDPRGPIEWNKAYNELENYGDKTLPIQALEEGDFIVIEK